MVLLLTVLNGIAWTIVYIDSIRVGFKRGNLVYLAESGGTKCREL
jgi:hypothetical protein